MRGSPSAKTRFALLPAHDDCRITAAAAVLSRLQLQRRRIDAVAQVGRAGAVLEHMAEMAVALEHNTSVRTMPWLTSRSSSTWLSSAGWVKLGQPQPESNLASDSNSVWPQPAQV